MSTEELLARRVAFIERIVHNSEDIGKTKIQKILYFLQESMGVPLKYRFRIHYFGPYSDEIDNALSLAKSLGRIDIQPDSGGFGYHVTPVVTDADESWQEYDVSEDPEIEISVENIDSTINILGQIDTPQIELYATIHFIGGPKSKLSKKQTVETVKRKKPKFSERRIEDAYDALKRVNLI